MGDRVADNLQLMYDAFGEKAANDIVADEPFEVDGVRFECVYRPTVSADSFSIVKPREHIDLVLEELAAHQGGRIFELGIAEGGSTALIALAGRPTTLISIDNEVEPLPALDDLIRQRGLEGSVHLHWGVDQGDAAALDELCRTHLGDEPLDLVFDDASHDLALTRTSFEALFPRLRPGGTYVIEDWNNHNQFYDAVRDELLRKAREGAPLGLRAEAPPTGGGAAPDGPRPRPLSDLAIELVLARATRADAIASVAVDAYRIVVRRGADPLPVGGFRLREQYHDHYDQDPGDPGRAGGAGRGRRGGRAGGGRAGGTSASG